MPTLGIIGTAGRKGKDFDDFAHLTAEMFRQMCNIAIDLCLELRIDGLVSGGAAWADHVAVDLSLNMVVDPGQTTLMLPEVYVGRKYKDSGYGSTGGTANYYHRRFSQKMGYDTLAQIGQCHAVLEYKSGANFFSRNTDIAKSCDYLLAFTFGRGPYLTPVAHDATVSAADAGLKDGGTADTWKKALCPKWHVNLREDNP